MEGNLLSVKFHLKVENIYFNHYKVWDMKFNLLTIQNTSHFSNSHMKTLFLLLFIGEDGESGELQKLLQQKGIPFSGSSFQACVNTWNKNTCKEILKENKIPTPRWITIESLFEIQENLDDTFFDQLRPFKDLFLKPAEDGSSIDVF